MKKKFFVVYDYGMGGVWSILHARSAEEITQKYPMLLAQMQQPDWMNAEMLQTIADHRTFDIDEPPTGWLLDLLAKRD